MIDRSSRFWKRLALFAVALAGLNRAKSAEADFSFRTDILPILTKAGCNAGACHGASSGQGGFRLSLLGYDPDEDFWTITREFEGRRLDVDAPEESLFLRKPTLQVEHEGDRRIRRSSADYRALLAWIARGASYGSRDLRVTSITVDPAEHLFASVAGQTELHVTAHLSDGSSREVTALALYSSNDQGTAEVDNDGRVTIRSPGLTSIMIRYGGQVAAARVATPFGATDVNLHGFVPRNFIDEEILTELRRLRIAPTGLSGDAEFLRRIYLDLTGRLPGPKLAREFLAKPSSETARTALVNQLIAGEEFVDYWTLKFADLLLISGKRGSEEATATYHRWVREQISLNKRWDGVAHELLTGLGDITKVGPANFYTLASDPRDMAEYAGSMFLGMQIGCARCHAHPSDRWTRDDYYEFSAFFARVEREGNRVEAKDSGEIEYPKTGKAVIPKPLGGPTMAQRKMEDRREEVARSITRDPLFARAMVNRIWKELLGRGLVEPVDDLRPTNPATHPGLLEKLAAEFACHDFNLRWLIRTIASSRTYQLSSSGVSKSQALDPFFARALWKPISAQVMVDATSQVTGVAEQFEGASTGTRAVQLVSTQTPSYALDVLGRCKRERNCEASSGRSGLAQALHLINGSTINGKLKGGVLDELAAATNAEIIEELYLRTLTRRPNAAEAKFWSETIETGADRGEALEDFLWTLLNCREFAYNH